jgi:hypothetical protein
MLLATMTEKQKTRILDKHCLLAENLTYADAYADLLWEENTVRWLKSSSSEQGVPKDMQKAMPIFLTA